jgi:hypothetical protein
MLKKLRRIVTGFLQSTRKRSFRRKIASCPSLQNEDRFRYEKSLPFCDRFLLFLAFCR